MGVRESKVLRAWNWWTEGLAIAFAHVDRVLRPPRRFRVRSGQRPFLLQPVEPAGASSPAITIADSTLPAAVVQQTRASVIEVMVPPEAMLEGKLDPLPAESRPYVDSIVRHQLGRLFPWRADDVLYAVSAQDRNDGKIDVSVRATPQAPIAALLQSLKACAPSEIRVVADSDEPRPSAIIPIPIARDGRMARFQRVAQYAVLGVLLLMCLTVGWSGFTYWSLSDDVAEVDAAIAARESLNRRGLEASGFGRDDLGSRKTQTAAAVAVLEALSTILPDDTYLTDMSLESGRLRISGISGRATELVPLLENSGRFKNASFYAPTTRVAGRSGDRFSIEASVIP